MPAVKSKVNLNDPQWITPEFKTLIAKRQQAFMSGDLASFRHLRNTVNRERKALRESHQQALTTHFPHTNNFQISRRLRDICVHRSGCVENYRSRPVWSLTEILHGPSSDVHASSLDARN
ncbi:unnamed protein product [Pocillopora meandrina]|uniref:Uncharacterized protein n=1 Tax=Pocillopora meandrina TaxID=46732 RepID=A0AAU9X7Y6_9CNID|nr:unnamed protein product [Pocillopora meandrina]